MSSAKKFRFEKLTGGPWGTFAHVEACRKATELLGTAARATACLLATLNVESMLAEVMDTRRKSKGRERSSILQKLNPEDELFLALGKT
jgi:hypothetical protein